MPTTQQTILSIVLRHPAGISIPQIANVLLTEADKALDASVIRGHLEELEQGTDTKISSELVCLPKRGQRGTPKRRLYFPQFIGTKKPG